MKLDGESTLLVSNATGSSTNFQISQAVTYDTANFSIPSFAVSTGAMAEGLAAASSCTTLDYYYYVPEGG